MLSGVSAAKFAKNEGLSIVGKFQPVRSEHVLTNLNGSDRYLVSLGEKSYTTTHQVKKGNDWVEVAKHTFQGAKETVLEKFKIYTSILTQSDYR